MGILKLFRGEVVVFGVALVTIVLFSTKDRCSLAKR